MTPAIDGLLRGKLPRGGVTVGMEVDDLEGDMPGGDMPGPTMKVGDISVSWLHDNDFHLDGGAMFGVVPKVLWTRRYPDAGGNYIPLTCRPLLIKTGDAAIVVDTGLGNKLTEKQHEIFKIAGPSKLDASLAAHGLTREDVTHVIFTHLDFDHASGATWAAPPPGVGGTSGVPGKGAGDRIIPTFPRAEYVVQSIELDDALAPNIRTRNTYFAENFAPLVEAGLIRRVEGEAEVVPGVTVTHTGGHTRGHQVVTISSRGETALHLADLMPTHAHMNPLWVMAYDNYPMDSIHQKVAWLEKARAGRWWLTFYHDPFMAAVRLTGEEGGGWSEEITLKPMPGR